MKAYEYDTEEVEFDRWSTPAESTLAIKRTITSKCHLGWELICVAHEGANKRVLYFKREVLSYEKV